MKEANPPSYMFDAFQLEELVACAREAYYALRRDPQHTEIARALKNALKPFLPGCVESRVLNGANNAG